MIRHVIGLLIALAFTLLIFLGAGYFGAVWTHYFSDEPPQQTPGEVSVKIIRDPVQAVPCAGCLSTPSPAEVRRTTKQKPHD